MAGETIFGEKFHEPDRDKALETTMGGSGLVVIGGLAAIVLAMRGLFGVVPGMMASIGVIIIGVAFISQGAAIAARYEELLKALDANGSSRPAAELAGGMTTEFIGGVTGVILGILALLGIAPLTMMSVALIAFGTALLMSTAETSRLISMGSLQEERARKIFRIAVPATTGGRVLVGLTSMILGVLALVMTPGVSMTLILVGVLAVGVAMLFSGSAVGGRMMLLAKH